MPSIEINTQCIEPSQVEGLPPFIRLPEGLVMIELQGTINKPTKVPAHYDEDKEDFIKTKSGHDAVKIGKLRYDFNDPSAKKVELLIGTSQKLIGSIKKLDKPMGILQFPKMDNHSNISDRQYLKTQQVQVVEIIRHKLVFTNRPVPLMDD
ncbi:Ctf8 protein [Saccharomycopsis crataegensis]|uniref:Ctf8 protein n=1 Tax=Saccharomycopsis crataegensis TaxID=43959 RepID=A0AAV5QMS3_9ASCO|nr:Ctf8 protein [Saccharomycopsis crataegensis]